MFLWNEYQKRLIGCCCAYLKNGRVYCSHFADEKQSGMAEMMKKLTGDIDLPVIWDLSCRKHAECFRAERLIAECLTEVFAVKKGTGVDPDISGSVANYFFPYRYQPAYPTISNMFLLPDDILDAAEKKDIPRLTFLLDVSDDNLWHRKQLLAFYLKKRDFETITSLGLYDPETLSEIKPDRVPPLFLHVDCEKYPEFATALYEYALAENINKYIFKRYPQPDKLAFLAAHGISPDTVLFNNRKCKITIRQYEAFLHEILPAALALRGKNRNFDDLLLNMKAQTALHILLTSEVPEDN